MNLPNKLTVLRICLVPFFVLFLLTDFTVHRFLIAGFLFAAASITDHFDGKIARERNLITDFGKFADPLADKILVISALICFVELGFISSVAVIIVITREFAVTSLRLVAVSNKGKVIAASKLGKVKTVTQIISILVFLLLEYVLELLRRNIIGVSSVDLRIIESRFNILGNVFIWVSVLFSIISGIKYIIDNRDFVKSTK